MRKSPTSVERKGAEKATVLDKVSTTIYEIAITLLELLLVPDQGKSRSYIMQVKIRRIEHQTPSDVRMSDVNGGALLPLTTTYWMKHHLEKHHEIDLQ